MGAAHVHGEAVESVELDFGRGDIGRRPREVSIGAAIKAVVAYVDRVEYQACATARARARVGCMRQLTRGDGSVVEPEPDRIAVKGHADLGDAWIVGVEHCSALAWQPRQ